MSPPDYLVTTYLELTTPEQFQAAFLPSPKPLIMASQIPLVPFYRFLYDAVGRQWRWYDRLKWSDEQLHTYLQQAHISIYVLYHQGTPVGYVELDAQSDGNTEIAYFGIMSAFFGQGYGKHLLSFGVSQAWRDGAKRVWLHTCNLDSPHALSNYQKRGFEIYDVQQQPMPKHYQ